MVLLQSLVSPNYKLLIKAFNKVAFWRKPIHCYKQLPIWIGQSQILSQFCALDSCDGSFFAGKKEVDFTLRNVFLVFKVPPNCQCWRAEKFILAPCQNCIRISSELLICYYEYSYSLQQANMFVLYRLFYSTNKCM